MVAHGRAVAFCGLRTFLLFAVELKEYTQCAGYVCAGFVLSGIGTECPVFTFCHKIGSFTEGFSFSL